MDSNRLVSNINIRLNLEDMNALKEEAIKLKDELIKSFDESNDKDSWHP